VLIRRATSGDVPAIAALVQAAYAKYVPRLGRRPAPMDADYGALVVAGEVWVRADGEELVGVLVARQSRDVLELENVAVAPARQGEGHGGALLAFAEERAQELQLAAIELYTNEAMEENLALYRRLGYVETERRVEDGYRRVFFRKTLDSRGFGR
jgi:ribosomal protein S18 acetylase RimI-like enzyme